MTLRISRKFKTEDWSKLDFTSEDQWQKAVDILEDRLQTRYLGHIAALLKRNRCSTPSAKGEALDDPGRAGCAATSECVAEFATAPPAIITGDNYEDLAGNLFDQVLRCKINIFNISKINSEGRGGRSPRIKRLSEYIGESYFDYLAGLPDLVLIMDESHRYRATAGSRAINELKPVMGLELTATPLVETSKGAIPFKNVIFDYPLGLAMADGFVKEPAVIVWFPLASIANTSNPCSPKAREAMNSGGTVTLLAVSGRVT